MVSSVVMSLTTVRWIYERGKQVRGDFVCNINDALEKALATVKRTQYNPDEGRKEQVDCMEAMAYTVPHHCKPGDQASSTLDTSSSSISSSSA